MLLSAIVEARSKLREEVARHEEVLSGCESERRRCEQAARREVEREVASAVASASSASGDAPPADAPFAPGVAPGRAAPADDGGAARVGGGRLLFAAAAFQFAEERLLRREALRRVGVVRSGYLRRATRRKQATVWRFHRVELRREAAGGVVTFCWSGVGDGGVRGDRSGERRVALRRGEASCAAALGGARPDGPGDDDAVFVLGAGDDRVAWMAASMGERDAWVEAVAACLEEGGDASRPPAWAPNGGDGPARRGVAAFEAAIARVARAGDRAAFVRALCGADLAAPPRAESDGEASRRFPDGARDAFPATAASFRVPVAWVRDRHSALRASVEQSPRRRRRPRPAAAKRGDGAAGDGGGAARGDPPPAEALRQRVVQMRKDMRRDRVSIDGEVVAADGGDGAPGGGEYHERVAAALARRLLEEARLDGARGGVDAASPRPLAALSEAGAVTHAAAVLVACTRTCSGGDAYACVHALCKPLGALIVLCPLSTHASPLELRVSFSRRRESAGPPRRPPPIGAAGAAARRGNLGSPSPSFAQKLLATLTTSPAPPSPADAWAASPPSAAGGSPLDGSHSPSDAWASTTDVPRDESGAATSDDDDGDGRDDDASPARGGRGAAFAAAPRGRRRPGGGLRSRVDVDVRATTVYRVCTANPQDEPSDTWALVRAVWTQSFAVTGDSAKGATNFKASEPQVHIGISDFTLWDPTEER